MRIKEKTKTAIEYCALAAAAAWIIAGFAIFIGGKITNNPALTAYGFTFLTGLIPAILWVATILNALETE